MLYFSRRLTLFNKVSVCRYYINAFAYCKNVLMENHWSKMTIMPRCYSFGICMIFCIEHSISAGRQAVCGIITRQTDRQSIHFSALALFYRPNDILMTDFQRKCFEISNNRNAFRIFSLKIADNALDDCSIMVCASDCEPSNWHAG